MGTVILDKPKQRRLLEALRDLRARVLAEGSEHTTE